MDDIRLELPIRDLLVRIAESEVREREWAQYLEERRLAKLRGLDYYKFWKRVHFMRIYDTPISTIER